MKISEAAQQTQLSPNLLRHYERIGLTGTIKRNPDGSRNYSSRDIKWIHLMKELLANGVTLEILLDYNFLYRLGHFTDEWQKDLLEEAQQHLIARYQNLMATMQQLNQVIMSYRK